MITKKSEATERLKSMQPLFDTIIGKPCVLTFDRHSYDGVIVERIELGKTTGLKNAPDKIEHEGKNRSPMIFYVVTNQGNLIFLFDYTIVTALTNGVRLRVSSDKPIVVDLRLQT